MQEIDILTLDYQLAELPSSQHRAGLAGLVLVLRWLERQPEFKQQVEAGAVCTLTRLDNKGATFKLNQAGLKALFDEIYAASTEEQERTQLFKNKQIWLDAGVFGSPYTNESAISKDHLMYTRSFAPEYVPYYLAGVKLSVP
ncbi:MAG: outer membrane beta-barrel protein, partial [Phormidesmis sp. RL_2_1]|nr:outer membrane beta-barrel protein [Phormidesmis sp. RL_2_1]